MGGSPTISGGMTFDEQKKLMDDERVFQKAQEEERRKAAEDSETRRVAREAITMARTKADEQAAIQTSTAAEQEAIMEAQSQAEAQGTRGIQGGNAKALDFYSALYNGVST